MSNKFTSEAEFEAFLSCATEELRRKQDLLQEQYDLGKWKRWEFDQATETLQFFAEADNLVIEADVVLVGSYASNSNTWRWAWANESLLPPLRKKAEPLRELEALTGFELFGAKHAFAVDGEEMAWELAAIAVKHLGALGCYKAPSTNGPTTFLAITEVHRIS